MIRSRVTRLAALCLLLASAGCMTLQEIPRQEYTARPERKGVRVDTVDGLVYDFDWASCSGDTLVGYRNHTEAEGPLDQVSVIRIPYADVQRLNARQLDWRRTGLVGGVVVGAVAAVGLRAVSRSNNSGGNSYGKPPVTPAPQ
jgi:hypothetical protein